jgi:archaellum biogenesis protein FlaJ (TadC family)
MKLFIKSLLAFHIFAILALYMYVEMKKEDDLLTNSAAPKEKEKVESRKNMLTLAWVLACIGSLVTLLLTLKGAADAARGIN